MDDVKESGGWMVDWTVGGLILGYLYVFFFLHSPHPAGESILHIGDDGRVYFSKANFADGSKERRIGVLILSEIPTPKKYRLY